MAHSMARLREEAEVTLTTGPTGPYAQLTLVVCKHCSGRGSFTWNDSVGKVTRTEVCPQCNGYTKVYRVAKVITP